VTPLLSLKQTCLDGSEIAGGNEASAFAPAVSSSTERFVPCCLPLLVLQMGAIVPCRLPRPDWGPRRCPSPMVKPLVAPRRPETHLGPIRVPLKPPPPRPNVDAQRPHPPANSRGDSPAIANPPSWVGKAPPPYLLWPIYFHHEQDFIRDRADPSQWPRDRPPPVNVRPGFTGPPVKPPPPHLVTVKPPPPHLVRPPQGAPPFKAPPCFRG